MLDNFSHLRGMPKTGEQKMSPNQMQLKKHEKIEFGLNS